MPHEAEGLALRHVVEVRHESFKDPAFVDLLRKYKIATVVADSDEFPLIPDVTAPFVYLRLQRSTEAEATGYSAAGLDWGLLSGFATRAPWMLAGGLTPFNVAEAVRVTGARQVDVSSGVESAPGLKDAGLIRAFAQALKG